MKVLIMGGYGEEKTTDVGQEEFLNHIREFLIRVGLPVDSIVSERITGGPITLEVPNVDPDEILRAFLALATFLAGQASEEERENIDVSFDLRLSMSDGDYLPLTVLGSGSDRITITPGE